MQINVTVQYLRADTKETGRVRLAMDTTVRAAVAELVQTFDLPREENGERCIYKLLKLRQALNDDARLFEVGVGEGDILQLWRFDPNATTAQQMVPGNIMSRVGGRAGDLQPLPVQAALTTRDGRVTFQLQHTRALIGRADAALGVPPQSLNADLTDLDPGRTVSRPHALIVYADGGFAIRDLYSQRGLRINGEAVAANTAQPLHHGDWLTFGDVELQFTYRG